MKKEKNKKINNSKETKRLKIIFFILLGISLLAFITILFIDDSSYKSILDSEPKVDKAIYEEWKNKEVSVEKIGN